MILLSLHYTSKEDVKYNGVFFHMCKMEEKWNMNIVDEFNLLWINVVDKKYDEVVQNV